MTIVQSGNPISLGDGGTGKSCIIKRYCEEKFVSR